MKPKILIHIDSGIIQSVHATDICIIEIIDTDQHAEDPIIHETYESEKISPEKINQISMGIQKKFNVKKIAIEFNPLKFIEVQHIIENLRPENRALVHWGYRNHLQAFPLTPMRKIIALVRLLKLHKIKSECIHISKGS